MYRDITNHWHCMDEIITLIINEICNLNLWISLKFHEKSRIALVFASSLYISPSGWTFPLKTEFATTRLTDHFILSFLNFEGNSNTLLSGWIVINAHRVGNRPSLFIDRSLSNFQPILPSFRLPVTYFALIQREAASYLSRKREKINGRFDSRISRLLLSFQPC